MTNDSPLKALLVALAVALVCSVMVSTTRVLLRPVRLAYEHLDRNRHIVLAAGLAEPGEALSDREIVAGFRELQAMIVDLETARPAADMDPAAFDQRAAAQNPDLSVAIPGGKDIAGLGRRSRFAPVYFLTRDGRTDRIVLPVRGTGMWSMIYGYLALGPDLNTIAAVTFYEQGETPGVGDRFLDPAWQAQWSGKTVYDSHGVVRFGIASAKPDALRERYEVDAITGATVTTDSITNLVRYWMGDHGFGPYLLHLRESHLQPETDQ
jgi:Na+-transporting NADH:ubiquinone oxidoreductase subunit C